MKFKIPIWIKKIIYNNMISEEQLISYKQNFTNQKFQWVKTDRPELIGKVVTCRDINISGNRIIAIFDDGSQVDAKDINNKLLMIHGDMQPLSPAEVASIYKPVKPISEGIPSTKLANGEMSTPIPPKQEDSIASQTSQPASNTSTPIINPFEMFNSDETEINIKVNIKMPDKKLLKMMYNNAEDKEIFIDQLAKYVNSMINNKVVNDSLSLMLDPKSATKKKSSSNITLTEVDESK